MKGQYEKWQIDAINELYVKQKRGLLYVSKQIHSTPKAIKKYLKANNIHIRNFGEATAASNQNRALKKNEKYFQSQSSNMAWLLGFLASDGSIAKDKNEIRINLSIIDKEILEKIKNELSLEALVKEYEDSHGYNSCRLTWTCQQHKNDLAKYSIIPQKTFCLKPPLLLRDEYKIDYIRGYFDGDGSVNYLSNGALRWQICGATKEVLEWIVDVLYTDYNIPKVNIQKEMHGTNILYYIQYSTTSTKKIYDILYTPGSLFLARKKKKFDEIIKMK